MRILYVEDNEINRFIMTKLMETKAQVIAVEKAGEALNYAKSEYFDLILIDLNLNDPEMDGFDVLRELKRIKLLEKSKFFAVTAYVGADWQKKCTEAGFDGFFSKPINTQLILDTFANSN